jgi:hypothetical protein
MNAGLMGVLIVTAQSLEPLHPYHGPATSSKRGRHHRLLSSLSVLDEPVISMDADRDVVVLFQSFHESLSPFAAANAEAIAATAGGLGVLHTANGLAWCNNNAIELGVGQRWGCTCDWISCAPPASRTLLRPVQRGLFTTCALHCTISLHQSGSH